MLRGRNRILKAQVVWYNQCVAIYLFIHFVVVYRHQGRTDNMSRTAKYLQLYCRWNWRRVHTYLMWRCFLPQTVSHSAANYSCANQRSWSTEARRTMSDGTREAFTLDSFQTVGCKFLNMNITDRNRCVTHPWWKSVPNINAFDQMPKKPLSAFIIPVPNPSGLQREYCHKCCRNPLNSCRGWAISHEIQITFKRVNKDFLWLQEFCRNPETFKGTFYA